MAHPTLLQSKNTKEKSNSSSILINIVFALYAQASYSIVKCYYELSKRLGNALIYEENRGGYLTDEMKLMVKIHDEVAANKSDENEEGVSDQIYASFDQILERSTLASCLKTVNEKFSIMSSSVNLNTALSISGVSRSVFNRTVKHYDKSMDNIKFLFATKSTSVS